MLYTGTKGVFTPLSFVATHTQHPNIVKTFKIAVQPPGSGGGGGGGVRGGGEGGRDAPLFTLSLGNARSLLWKRSSVGGRLVSSGSTTSSSTVTGAAAGSSSSSSLGRNRGSRGTQPPSSGSAASSALTTAEGPLVTAANVTSIQRGAYGERSEGATQTKAVTGADVADGALIASTFGSSSGGKRPVVLSASEPQTSAVTWAGAAGRALVASSYGSSLGGNRAVVLSASEPLPPTSAEFAEGFEPTQPLPGDLPALVRAASGGDLQEDCALLLPSSSFTRRRSSGLPSALALQSIAENDGPRSATALEAAALSAAGVGGGGRGEVGDALSLLYAGNASVDAAEVLRQRQERAAAGGGHHASTPTIDIVPPLLPAHHRFFPRLPPLPSSSSAGGSVRSHPSSGSTASPPSFATGGLRTTSLTRCGTELGHE